MGWKKFLKPTLAKVIIFVILFTFFTFLPTGFVKDVIGSFKVFPEVHELGFPLSFYEEGICGVPAVIGHDIKTYCPPTFSIIKLIVDLIFWYLISSLFIQPLNKKLTKK